MSTTSTLESPSVSTDDKNGGFFIAPTAPPVTVRVELPTQYQKFIHQARYARYLEDEKRRERWDETVARYFDFFEGHLLKRCGFTLDAATRHELEHAVLNLEVMPSMRCLMTAGKALQRDEVAGYNCSYIALDSPQAFDETMYILMCGTGVGFSCESKYTSKLPLISEEMEPTDTVIVVEDSKIGWSKAYRELLALLWAGQIPTWDLSRIRPKGARLKTFGGRASGPDPLNELFEFCVALFKNAKGRRLSPLECHDIMCKTGEIVVVGGVRRSALISLSDLGDAQMREAKFGQWWVDYSHRRLANNSAIYEGRPPMSVFMDEWHALYTSKSGERGIFNRDAARKHIARLGRRNPDFEWGCNPCSEILLRMMQFCNLSEVVARVDDTLETLLRKVELATILGTFQSTLTNLRYLRSKWKKNTEEERLLGVSLTGIMDCTFLRECSGAVLEKLREHAVAINKMWAQLLGIPASSAITCVKPSGTASGLVDSASGIHARHAPQYIRTVRGDKKDPLTQFLQIVGVPVEDCVSNPQSTAIFSFPLKSPAGAVTRNDMSALEQLEVWLKFQRHYCEHKPSVTINVREEEWMEVGAWVYKHFDEVSGISFLPHSDHSYKQAPLQDCTLEEYNAMEAMMPVVNWEDLALIETEDMTTSSQELACVGGSCDVLDIGGVG